MQGLQAPVDQIVLQPKTHSTERRETQSEKGDAVLATGEGRTRQGVHDVMFGVEVASLQS